uniref:Uncharacterized protein n=1 Tax=Oryza brachyantha TaxID=4533 RepID=J3M6B6_ORYBR
MALLSHFLFAMLLSNGVGFIIAAQVEGVGPFTGIPMFNGIDGGKTSVGGSDQICHVVPHHGTVPGPSDPLGPPSDKIGDGNRFPPSGPSPNHNKAPPVMTGWFP